LYIYLYREVGLSWILVNKCAAECNFIQPGFLREHTTLWLLGTGAVMRTTRPPLFLPKAFANPHTTSFTAFLDSTWKIRLLPEQSCAKHFFKMQRQLFPKSDKLKSCSICSVAFSISIKELTISGDNNSLKSISVLDL
jgi:hypothetical protein